MTEITYTLYEESKKEVDYPTIYKSLEGVKKVWGKKNCVELNGKLIVINEAHGEVFIYTKK